MSHRVSPFQPRRLVLAVLLAELAVGVAVPALAQTGAAASADSAIAVLPQVLVTGQGETATSAVAGYLAKRSATATKTDTKLSETPQAVTVVTRDQIIDQGAGNLQDALNYAAGVRSDAYGIDSRNDGMLVRGVSPDEYLDGVRKSMSYYTSTARTDPCWCNNLFRNTSFLWWLNHLSHIRIIDIKGYQLLMFLVS